MKISRSAKRWVPLIGVAALVSVLHQNCSNPSSLSNFSSVALEQATHDSIVVSTKENSPNSKPAQIDEIRLDGDSKMLVGAYYFGVFNNSFRSAYQTSIIRWPIDIQQRPLIWWYGVEDLFKKQGPAYQDLVLRDPTYDSSHFYPTIGFYDNSQVSVLEKHIDQASDGGLDYFNFYWYWSKRENSEVMQESLNAFKQARNKVKLKFQITLFLHPWETDFNLTDNGIARAVDQILVHVRDPQYLKINGSPVITIGDARNIKDGTLGALQDAMGYIRFRFNEAQVGNPIILIHPGAINKWDQAKPDGYQCLTPSPALISHQGNYDKFVDDHTRFFQQVKSVGLPFSPCVASQFDERPRYKVFIDDYAQLRFFSNFSMESFDRALSLAVNSSKQSAAVISRLLNIYAWNEWHEGGIIEPNQKNGTQFLETIEANLKTKPLNLFINSSGKKIATSQDLILGYSKTKSWKLFSERHRDQTNKIALFECKITAQTSPYRFLSTDRYCEGQTNVNWSLPIGFALISNKRVSNKMKLLYRCNSYGEYHFVSESENCDRLPGQNIINEGPLGYVPF